MTRKGDQLATDSGPFSIVPEWLLDPGVSARAIQLYALLGRYADRNGGSCHPGRRTLAERLGCSVDSVDRATKELVAVGTLTVVARRTPGGDRTSNAYTVRRIRPGGGRTGAATGGRTGAAGTRTILN